METLLRLPALDERQPCLGDLALALGFEHRHEAAGFGGFDDDLIIALGLVEEASLFVEQGQLVEQASIKLAHRVRGFQSLLQRCFCYTESALLAFPSVPTFGETFFLRKLNYNPTSQVARAKGDRHHGYTPTNTPKRKRVAS